MLTLTPNECRVLGVLVEKAFTVAASYPLTLNSIVVGANQKNNRDPITNLDEEAALDALDGLRRHKLAVEVSMSGSRVSKYRHLARETLQVTSDQLAILTELLLRGPQSPGELRSRAGRMVPLESLDKTVALLESLINRPEPLARELAPAGRARRFAQLLCPDLHPLDHVSGGEDGEIEGAAAAAPTGSAAGSGLSARVEKLEAELAHVKTAMRAMAERLGEPDPFPGGS
jgi:uncharacterized protein